MSDHYSVARSSLSGNGYIGVTNNNIGRFLLKGKTYLSAYFEENIAGAAQPFQSVTKRSWGIIIVQGGNIVYNAPPASVGVTPKSICPGKSQILRFKRRWKRESIPRGFRKNSSYNFV